MQVQTGYNTYDEKWGHQSCELMNAGLELGDAWRVVHDWED